MLRTGKTTYANMDYQATAAGGSGRDSVATVSPNMLVQRRQGDAIVRANSDSAVSGVEIICPEVLKKEKGCPSR